MIKTAALVFFAMFAGVAIAEPPPPSADASTIARAVLPTGSANPGLEAIRHFMAQSLVHAPYGMGPVGCDRAIPACKVAADKEADRIAPAVVKKLGDLNVLSVAEGIDARLNAKQRAAAVVILATPDGLAFARALAIGPDHFERENAKQMIVQSALQEAMARFVSATSGLPRRPVPIGPPPVQQPR